MAGKEPQFRDLQAVTFLRYAARTRARHESGLARTGHAFGEEVKSEEPR
jgi:hypothetical protein